MGAHEGVHPLHLLICAFSLEPFLPCLSILDCEFGNLVIVDEFVLTFALSIVVVVTFVLALATSSFLAAVWCIFFLCLCDGLPSEIGWEGYVEAVKEYQHVELVEVDELLVDVFAIDSPATFVEEEVYLFIDGEENFCSKVFVTSDVAFILKALLFGFFYKLAKLACQDAQLSEGVLACQHIGFKLEDKGVVVMGYQGCHFGRSLNFVKVSHQTSFLSSKDFDQVGLILFIVCG
jgi:hypothetical protein